MYETEMGGILNSRTESPPVASPAALPLRGRTHADRKKRTITGFFDFDFCLTNETNLVLCLLRLSMNKACGGAENHLSAECGKLP